MLKLVLIQLAYDYFRVRVGDDGLAEDGLNEDELGWMKIG